MTNRHAPDDGQSLDPNYVNSYDDVSVFALSDDREQRLLDAQTECTFMWTTASGDPVGVIMNYVVTDNRFWVTCTRRPETSGCR